MSKTIYLSGPMTGLPLYNFPAFDEATTKLRADGWAVLSPAEHDRECGFDGTEEATTTHTQAMFEWDVWAVLNADAIGMLAGWRKSTGARIEAALAAALGREFYMVNGDRYWTIPTPRLDIRVAA